MTRTFSTMLVLAVAGIARPVHAAPTSVSLEVDVSALPAGKSTRSLKTHLVEHQTRTIEDSGLELVEEGETTIRVVVSRYGEGDVNYRATIALVERGEEAPQLERTINCELCRDGDLASRVGQEVAWLSGWVLYSPKEPGGADPGAGPELEPDAEPETAAEPDSAPQMEPNDGTETAAKAKRISPLGFAGIASMAVGVGALGGGIPLALRADRARPAPSGVERQSTRPAGFALIGIGGALLVGGAALLVVDVVRRRKSRAVSVLPYVTPSTASVSMGMRF